MTTTTAPVIDAQPVIDHETHTVQVTFTPATAAQLVRCLVAYYADHRRHLAELNAMATGITQAGARPIREAWIAEQAAEMVRYDRLQITLGPVQAQELSDALADAAIEPEVCSYQTFHYDCPDLATDGDRCPEHAR